MEKQPEIHSVWRHKNGNLYMIYDFTNNNEGDELRENYPPMISYYNISNRKRYSRKLSDWTRSFTYVPNYERNKNA